MQVTARGAEVLHSILPYRDATASTSGNQTWSSLSVQCAVNQRFIVRNHRGRLVAYSTATSDDTDEEGAKSPNHVVILPCEGESQTLARKASNTSPAAGGFSLTHCFDRTLRSRSSATGSPHHVWIRSSLHIQWHTSPCSFPSHGTGACTFSLCWP